MKLIKVKIFDSLKIPLAKLPTRATNGSAAYDLYSYEALTLYPHERRAVGTGLVLEIPEGYVGQICPRSGLAIKTGITVLNAPGLVDSDFRGEVRVILVNQDAEDPVVINVGDRIAQLLVVPCEEACFIEVNETSTTNRGAGGFGSTGI